MGSKIGIRFSFDIFLLFEGHDAFLDIKGLFFPLQTLSIDIKLLWKILKISS